MSGRLKRIIALSAAFAMLGLDQLTKHWALASLGAVGTTIELVGPIDLTLVLNRSNAFGLIPAYGEFSRWALTALNLAVSVFAWICVAAIDIEAERFWARLYQRRSARKCP